MKIGIYPGAFDPVHNGHVAFAIASAKRYGLDRVYFLPEPRPRHKQGVKALEHRVAMLEFATKHDESLGVIQLDQQRFTILETWPIITARFEGAQLFMLLGSDVARRLTSWPHIQEFSHTLPHFIIGARDADIQLVHEVMDVLQQTKGMRVAYDIFETEHQQYNSTRIRAGLRKGHKMIEIDPLVTDYIVKHQLYSRY